ncbi:MAG: hypothetical protein IKA76_08965 [Clostridia bacterium]|nr:hypothetical protein [Clostridia bacterium]
MFNKWLEGTSRGSDHDPREGEVYKVVTTFGKTFELRYGYYSEIDRSGAPDIIYPDFLAHPIYTDEGERFVTMMQDACEQFSSTSKRGVDSTCAECKHFTRGEEWFGICTCADHRKQ